EHVPDRLAGPCPARRLEERAEAVLRVGEERQDRNCEEARRDARGPEPGHRVEPEIRPRGPRLDAPGQPGIPRCERHVDHQVTVGRDGREQVQIAYDHRRLRGDGDPNARDADDGFENLPCDLESAFRRLVGIRGCAEGHFLPAVARPLQPGAELARLGPLNVDPALELSRLGVTQVAMRRPCVAVPAPELAPAERIDRPSEGHPRIFEPVDQLLRCKGQELDASPLVHGGSDTLHERRGWYALPDAHIVTWRVYMN